MTTDRDAMLPAELRAPHVDQEAVRRGLELVQRTHELTEALDAARRLQARLELLGDRASDVQVVRSLRDSLARDLLLIAGSNLRADADLQAGE